jgi:hypothetical protein
VETVLSASRFSATVHIVNTGDSYCTMFVSNITFPPLLSRGWHRYSGVCSRLQFFSN